MDNHRARHSLGRPERVTSLLYKGRKQLTTNLDAKYCMSGVAGCALRVGFSIDKLGEAELKIYSRTGLMYHCKGSRGVCTAINA